MAKSLAPLPFQDAVRAIVTRDMSLEAGSRIGPYEIQSLLGIGGMGEVYRARDSRLRRDVAIKILWHASFRDVAMNDNVV